MERHTSVDQGAHSSSQTTKPHLVTCSTKAITSSSNSKSVVPVFGRPFTGPSFFSRSGCCVRAIYHDLCFHFFPRSLSGNSSSTTPTCNRGVTRRLKSESPHIFKYFLGFRKPVLLLL